MPIPDNHTQIYFWVELVLGVFGLVGAVGPFARHEVLAAQKLTVVDLPLIEIDIFKDLK